MLAGIVAFMLLSLVSAAQTGSSGHNKPYGIIPQFLKNNTTHLVSEVASNVLRVTNNTGKTVSFHLRFAIPQNWQLTRQNSANYEIPAGDSLFIPVRIIADKMAKGNTSYVVSAFLISDKEVQFASQSWYVAIENQSAWSATIPLKKIFFINDADSTGFSIRFQNSGNADELIRLNFSSDRRLEVIPPFSKNAGSSRFDLSLPVGTDTILNFGVIRKKENKSFINKKDITEKTSSLKEEYTVQVNARDEGFQGKSGQSWTGTVSFFKIGNEIKLNEFKRTALPLTLELNTYDLLSTSTTMSIDAYGNAILSNDQLLNYRFQSVFITNFLNEKTFLGNNHYLGYFSNKGSLELGEISGWGRSLISGKGIKGTVKIGSNQVGAVVAKSPDLFAASRTASFGFYHHYDAKQYYVSNYFSRITDNFLKQTNTIYSSYANFKFHQHHQAGIGAGYSSENYGSAPTPFTAKGYGYEVNYSAGFNRLYLTLNDQFGSNNYLLARGMNMISGRATYNLNKNINLSISNQNFHQHADYYFAGSLYPGKETRSARYEFRIGFLSPASTVFFKPSYADEYTYSLHTITKGLGIEYNARDLTNVHFATNLFAGYVKSPDYDLPNFFIARFGANAKWSKLNLSLRYLYGPGQASEQLRFIKNKINPQSINLTSTYDYWFGKGRYLISTSAGLMHETYFQKTTFRIKPELFYFSKTGFRFSVYTTFASTTQGANPMLNELLSERGGFQKISNNELNIGFGIKKQIGIPVPGKKFRSIKVIVFKDRNGNKIQDANEEGIENILINMRMVKPLSENPDSDMTAGHSHGDDFITNSNGEINYSNIQSGLYHIKMIPLVQMGEWFDGKEEDVLVDGKQVVYLPLNKGVRLTGAILVERDKYTNDGADLDFSRIRVTAIDSAGKTYSALTDKNGGFSLYLPMGNYTLTINEAAFGDRYECIQSKIAVDLTKPVVDNYSITFNIVEKKRKMEIKKFNNSEEPLNLQPIKKAQAPATNKKQTK